MFEERFNVMLRPVSGLQPNEGAHRPTFEGAFERGPMRTFIRLEAADWAQHNVETLFEHAWARFGTDAPAWDDAIYNGIYFFLFRAFTEQFGLGPALNLNPMKA